MLAMSAIRIEELAPDLWRYWIPCPVCDGEGHYDVTLPPRPTDLSPRERRVRCGACESGLYEVERHIDDAMVLFRVGHVEQAGADILMRGT